MKFVLNAVVLASVLASIANGDGLRNSIMSKLQEHQKVSTMTGVDNFAHLKEKTGDEFITGVINLAKKLISDDDKEFDLLTTAVSLVNGIEVSRWTAPTSKDVNVGPKKEVDTQVCGLIEDRYVSTSDENWEDISKAKEVFGRFLVEALDFPDDADESGYWSPEDDPQAILLKRTFGGFAEERVLVGWNQGDYSDEQLKLFFFYGIGQHRLESVRDDDSNAPKGAAYAVYLDFAEGLPVKEGMGKLGGNVYFGLDKNVIAITRLGKTFTPGDSSRPVCKYSHGFFGIGKGWKCPTKPTWEFAKMAIRGTLSAVITIIDHLYWLHLVLANGLAITMIEQLPQFSDFRYFLTPFTFRTNAINFKASFALANEFGLIHRSAPLTEEGLDGIYAYAKKNAVFKTVPEMFASQNVDALNLPYHQDGMDYYNIVHEFVSDAILGSPDTIAKQDCKNDMVKTWYEAYKNSFPNKDLPSLNCENLIDVLSTVVWSVSAFHTHVGAIGAELKDPRLAPWAFRPAETIGFPRTTYTQIAIMCATSFEQPKIMDPGYINNMPTQSLKDAWKKFQAKLVTMQHAIGVRNLLRERPFLAFDISRMETAISI